MRGVLLSAAIAVGALSSFSATPAAAIDYPYCVQGRGVGYPGECSYSTYEQCQASASGRNVGCGINPRVAFGQARQRGYDDRNYVPRERGNRRVTRDDYYYDRRY